MTNKEIKMLASNRLPALKNTKEGREIASSLGVKHEKNRNWRGEEYYLDVYTLGISISKIKGIDLCLNVFSDKGLEYRWLIKDQYSYVYIVKDKTLNGPESMLRTRLDNSFYRYKEIYTESSVAEVKKYLGLSRDVKHLSIYTIEEHLRDLRRTLAAEKKATEIDLKMKPVRKIPKSFAKTIDSTMSEYRYLFFDRKSKECTCSACNGTYAIKNVPAFKENDLGRCPICKKKSTYKSISRAFTKKGMAALIQAYGYHQLIVRYFFISYQFDAFKTQPIIRVKEVLRDILDYDKKTVEEFEWWSLKDLPSQEKRWVYSTGYRAGYVYYDSHYPLENGLLHHNGLKKELQKADLLSKLNGGNEFSQFVINTYNDKSCYGEVRYFEELCKKPFFEYLVKCKMFNIASHLLKGTLYGCKINPQGTSLHQVLNVTKFQAKQLREMDASYSLLEILWEYNSSTETVRSVKDILAMANAVHNVRLSEAFKYSDSEFRKVVKYLNDKDDRNWVDYVDYIKWCEQLNYEMKSELVLYPLDFKKAHDDAHSAVVYEKNKELYAKIKPQLEKMHKTFDFDNKKLLIRAPFDGAEITREGQLMNHCVGGYVKRVADGESVILFLRKKSNPDKPYVTIEVSNGRMVQARAFGNANPKKECWNLIEKWKKEKGIA